MMTPEMKARSLEIIRDVKADCAADVDRREGQPLTGQNMGVWLGEMSGLIVGLANVLEVVVDAMETD